VLNREKYKRPKEQASLDRLKQLNPATDTASNQSAVSQASAETVKTSMIQPLHKATPRKRRQPGAAIQLQL
jgi:hypothetical protein